MTEQTDAVQRMQDYTDNAQVQMVQVHKNTTCFSTGTAGIQSIGRGTKKQGGGMHFHPAALFLI